MERIVDIATDGRHLSAHRGFLVVSEGREEIGRIALDDISAVIVHAHGVTFTTSLIVALAERGSVMVLCANNHSPVALCLPLEGHHADSDVKPAGIPINIRPPFRFEAGHDSNQLPAGFRH